MNEGSTDFRKLSYYDIKSETIEAFLKLLGIICRNEYLLSSRNIDVFFMIVVT